MYEAKLHDVCTQAELGHQPKKLDAYDDEFKCIEQANRAVPNHLILLSRKCDFLSNRTRRYNEALKCYNKVIELFPNNGWVWRSKGHLLASRMGDVSAAEKCFEKAEIIRDRELREMHRENEKTLREIREMQRTKRSRDR